MQNRIAVLSLLTSLLLIVGCGESEDGSAESGAVCPKTSTLTYDNFAKDFFDTYCIDCHSTTLKGSARRGAPLNHDFDTLAAILEVPAEHIDESAAAGPNAVNEFMPSSGRMPTLEERKKLGEWLACGRP